MKNNITISNMPNCKRKLFISHHIRQHKSYSRRKKHLWLNWYVAEATDKQMNRETDRWILPLHKASLQWGANPLIATLKLQSKGPSYSNTVIGTLAVDWWAVTFGTTRIGLGAAAAHPVPSSLYQMYQSTASVQTSYYSMWHYNCYNCLWSLKG